MRVRAARADSGHVTSHTVHIDIDVRIDGDQITGHAGDGLSRPRPFLGWLGLIGALDRLLTEPGSAEGPVPGSASRLDGLSNSPPLRAPLAVRLSTHQPAIDSRKERKGR